MDKSFERSSVQRLVQLQQYMCEALKSKDYDKALEHANKILLIQPGNAVVQQFVSLIQEKIDLDNETEYEDDDDAGTTGQTVEPVDEEDDEDTEEEDEDEEDEDEEEEEEGGEEELGPAEYDIPSADLVAVPPASFGMTRSLRNQLRQKIAKDLEQLKMAEHAKKVIESEPLLGA